MKEKTREYITLDILDLALVRGSIFLGSLNENG